VTLAERLAAFAAAPEFDHLPPDVVASVRLRALDVLGLALAASTYDFAAPVMAVASDGGPCSIIGSMRTASPAGAALVNGTLATRAASIQPPPNNQQLKLIAQSSYQWTGQTDIVLNGNTMTVTNRSLNNGQPTSMPFPCNGVVFVPSTSFNPVYSPVNLTYPPVPSSWSSSGCESSNRSTATHRCSSCSATER